MGIAERIWNGLSSVIKLEDAATRQAETLSEQQLKIQDLTARVIRLEAQFELLTSASLIKRVKGD
jgi:hypothetical protein